MQRILYKRVLRDLGQNAFRYLALFLLISLGMYIVVSLVAAADTVIIMSGEASKENNLESGQFAVFLPLTPGERVALEKEEVSLEEHFYLDYELADASVLRIFARREKIDLVRSEAGRLPEKEDEILLEKRYCEEHGIVIGDCVLIGGHSFLVCGTGTAPDYEAPFKNLSDAAVDSSFFGIGFVSREAYEQLKKEEKSLASEAYSYAYCLGDGLSQEKWKEKLKALEMESGNASFPKLINFVQAKDNARIGAAADDQRVNKASGLAAGIILLLLVAYVLSVYTVQNIERESGIIGTLYAMGVKRKELLVHYLACPAVLALLAGIAGTATGYSRLGVNIQMKSCYAYFSLPVFHTVYEPYLLWYGIVMPPVVSALINFIVIRGKLGKTALTLMRGETKETARQRYREHVMRIKGSFVHVFWIRRLVREGRVAFTVFSGMFISLLVVMLALDSYTICEHVRTQYKEDTKFAYMYTYKYPEEKPPEGGEAAYGVPMKKEVLGYYHDVTLLGIRQGNPYFDAQVKEGENRVLVSSAMAQKYRLGTGDILVLEDKESKRYYAFMIDGVVPYSAGFFAFMDIGSMRKLMGEDEDYYNIVFADHALAADREKLYSTLSKEGIEKSAAVFVDLMMPMVTMLLSVSIILFIVVMYLMMKVMVERSSESISLFKVFGYRKREIRKLYLDGNFLIVTAGALIGIPLSKLAMDALFPYLVANVACGIDLAFPVWMYAGALGGVLALYGVINCLLMHRVNKILPEQILKNRE